MTSCGLPISAGEIELGSGASKIVFSCGSGIVATELQVGFPADRPVVRPRALGSGTIDTSSFKGNRAITLSVTLDSSILPVQTLLDRIMPLMSAGLRPLAWRLGDTPLGPGVLDNRWRWVQVRGVDAPTIIGGPRYPTIVLSFVTASATLPSNLLFSPTSTSQTLSQSAAAQTITTYGTAQVPWFLRFDGPLSAVRVTINSILIEFDASFSLLAGQSVTLDSFARRTTSDKPGFANPYYLLNSTDWTWEEIGFQPGANSVLFPIVVGAGTLLVNYRNGWY